MIRCISTALQRTLHYNIQQMSQKKPYLNSLLYKNLRYISEEGKLGIDALAQKQGSAQAAVSMEDKIDADSEIKKQTIRPYKPENICKYHGECNYKPKNGFSFSIKTALLMIPVCLFAFFYYQHIFIFQRQIKERQLKKYKINQGQKVKQYMNDIVKRIISGQMEEFQFTKTEQQQLIAKILVQTDSKVMHYVQAFHGNGFKNNLIRSLNRNKENFLIYDFKEPPMNSPTYDSQIQSLKGLLTNAFERGILKGSNQPPSRSPTDNGIEWGQLASLHYLLTNLIEQGKEDKSQRKYLIINQINLISRSFQYLKHQRIQELFKQIVYLNRYNIARVILISGDYQFYDRCSEKLHSSDFLDFKRTVIGQISNDDLKQVLKTRMAYDQIKKYISNKDIEKLNKFIDKIAENTDSVKESMRILKAAKLDAKSLYGKYLKGKRQQHKKELLERYLIKYYVPNIINLEQRMQPALQIYSRFVISNAYRIHRSIGINTYKDVDEKTIEMLKKIQYYKIMLLDDISKDRLCTQNQKSSFYLGYDYAKLQAFRQLNIDEILHGFQFVSKTMKNAYFHAVMMNPSYLKMKLAYEQAAKSQSHTNLDSQSTRSAK